MPNPYRTADISNLLITFKEIESIVDNLNNSHENRLNALEKKIKKEEMGGQLILRMTYIIAFVILFWISLAYLT